ncbi:hypothetical protein [Streptacidiphilus sp. MAP5-3]|uniref:hypothetical protein n=1 Tax=unclassified Streptacidiphilus TaxID=2643834 RepID=UPI003515635C
MTNVRDWDSLTLAEQTLLRAGARNLLAAWTPEHYSTAQRWVGDADAPLRSLTTEESRERATELMPVALDLHERGELFVAKATGQPWAYTHELLPPTEQRAFLADPENWLVKPATEPAGRRIALAVQPALREHLTAVVDRLDPKDHPTLSADEHEHMICAFEYSGWLTGPYGIWQEMRQGLDEAARLAFVDEQVAPLLPLVRNGWIEVRHVAATDSADYTVIPLEQLRTALADPAIRYEGDDWGIGVTCGLTFAGVAVSRRPR